MRLRDGLTVLGFSMLAGCCMSYESDLQKMCSIEETCADAFGETAISRAERDELVGDCMGTKLYSSEGRSLFAELSSPGNAHERSRRLRDEAKKHGISKCGWADRMLADLNLPAAPNPCTSLPDDETAAEVFVSTSALMVGDQTVLTLPARDDLEKGFGETYRAKSPPGTLVIEPLAEALLHARQPLRAIQHAKGQSSLRALVFIQQGVTPLPPVARRELLQSIRAAHFDDVQQVFLSGTSELCAVPLSAE